VPSRADRYSLGVSPVSPDEAVAQTQPGLDELERLLAAPELAGRALGVDALQALCVALAIGPDADPPSDWIAVAVGLEDPDVAPPPEVAAALERFFDATAAQVREGTLSLLLQTLRRGRADYASWARGFLTGVELSPAGWYDSADPEDVDELLFPIEVIADELTDDERAQYSPAAWRRLVLDSEAGLAATIARIRDFWAIVRHPPQTVRHASPKVGRNDPCPCGSGRKHKLCCGR
jgi:uncharacterized protein